MAIRSQDEDRAIAHLLDPFDRPSARTPITLVNTLLRSLGVGPPRYEVGYIRCYTISRFASDSMPLLCGTLATLK